MGVNEFVDPHDHPIDILKIGPEIEREQIDSVGRLRSNRDESRVQDALQALPNVAKDDDENLIPPMIDCARAYCTEGEIVGALREVFGEYTETPRF